MPFAPLPKLDEFINTDSFRSMSGNERLNLLDGYTMQWMENNRLNPAMNADRGFTYSAGKDKIVQDSAENYTVGIDTAGDFIKGVSGSVIGKPVEVIGGALQWWNDPEYNKTLEGLDKYGYVGLDWNPQVSEDKNNLIQGAKREAYEAGIGVVEVMDPEGRPFEPPVHQVDVQSREFKDFFFQKYENELRPLLSRHAESIGKKNIGESLVDVAQSREFDISRSPIRGIFSTNEDGILDLSGSVLSQSQYRDVWENNENLSAWENVKRFLAKNSSVHGTVTGEIGYQVAGYALTKNALKGASFTMKGGKIIDKAKAFELKAAESAAKAKAGLEAGTPSGLKIAERYNKQQLKSKSARIAAEGRLRRGESPKAFTSDYYKTDAFAQTTSTAVTTYLDGFVNYAQLVEQGADPDEIARLQAVFYLTTFLGERVGLEALTRNWNTKGGVRGVFGGFIKGGSVEGVTEVIQDSVNNLAEADEFDEEVEVTEFIDGAIESFMGGFLGGGTFSGDAKWKKREGRPDNLESPNDVIDLAQSHLDDAHPNSVISPEEIDLEIEAGSMKPVDPEKFETGPVSFIHKGGVPVDGVAIQRKIRKGGNIAYDVEYLSDSGKTKVRKNVPASDVRTFSGTSTNIDPVSLQTVSQVDLNAHNKIFNKYKKSPAAGNISGNAKIVDPTKLGPKASSEVEFARRMFPNRDIAVFTDEGNDQASGGFTDKSGDGTIFLKFDPSKKSINLFNTAAHEVFHQTIGNNPELLKKFVENINPENDAVKKILDRYKKYARDNGLPQMSDIDLMEEAGADIFSALLGDADTYKAMRDASPESFNSVVAGLGEVTNNFIANINSVPESGRPAIVEAIYKNDVALAEAARVINEGQIEGKTRTIVREMERNAHLTPEDFIAANPALVAAYGDLDVKAIYEEELDNLVTTKSNADYTPLQGLTDAGKAIGGFTFTDSRIKDGNLQLVGADQDSAFRYNKRDRESVNLDVDLDGTAMNELSMSLRRRGMSEVDPEELLGRFQNDVEAMNTEQAKAKLNQINKDLRHFRDPDKLAEISKAYSQRYGDDISGLVLQKHILATEASKWIAMEHISRIEGNEVLAASRRKKFNTAEGQVNSIQSQIDAITSNRPKSTPVEDSEVENTEGTEGTEGTSSGNTTPQPPTEIDTRRYDDYVIANTVQEEFLRVKAALKSNPELSAAVEDAVLFNVVTEALKDAGINDISSPLNFERFAGYVDILDMALTKEYNVSPERMASMNDAFTQKARIEDNTKAAERKKAENDAERAASKADLESLKSELFEYYAQKLQDHGNALPEGPSTPFLDESGSPLPDQNLPEMTEEQKQEKRDRARERRELRKVMTQEQRDADDRENRREKYRAKKTLAQQQREREASANLIAKKEDMILSAIDNIKPSDIPPGANGRQNLERNIVDNIMAMTAEDIAMMPDPRLSVNANPEQESIVNGTKPGSSPVIPEIHNVNDSAVKVPKPTAESVNINLANDLREDIRNILDEDSFTSRQEDLFHTFKEAIEEVGFEEFTEGSIKLDEFARTKIAGLANIGEGDKERNVVNNIRALALKLGEQHKEVRAQLDGLAKWRVAQNPLRALQQLAREPFVLDEDGVTGYYKTKFAIYAMRSGYRMAMQSGDIDALAMVSAIQTRYDFWGSKLSLAFNARRDTVMPKKGLRETFIIEMMMAVPPGIRQKLNPGKTKIDMRTAHTVASQFGEEISDSLNGTFEVLKANGFDISDMDALVERLENPLEMAVFTRLVAQSKNSMRNRVFEFFVSSILSGLTTMVINTTNIIKTAVEVYAVKNIESGIAEVLDFYGIPNDALNREEYKRMRHVFNTELSKAFSSAKLSFLAEQSMLDQAFSAENVADFYNSAKQTAIPSNWITQKIMHNQRVNAAIKYQRNLGRPTWALEKMIMKDIGEPIDRDMLHKDAALGAQLKDFFKENNWGGMTRLPFRALSFVDELVRVSSYNAMVEGKAMRDAAKIKNDLFINEGIDKDINVIKEEILNDLGSDLNINAMKWADENSFRDLPEDGTNAKTALDAINHLRNHQNPFIREASRYTIPFLMTPYSLIHDSFFRRTIVGTAISAGTNYRGAKKSNLAAHHARNALIAQIKLENNSDTLTRQEQQMVFEKYPLKPLMDTQNMADIILSVAGLFLTIGLFGSEDDDDAWFQMTGSPGPMFESFSARRTKMGFSKQVDTAPRNSFRVNIPGFKSKWIDLSRFDPFVAPMIMYADIRDSYRAHMDGDYENSLDMWKRGGFATLEGASKFAKFMKDKSYFEGLANLSELVTSPISKSPDRFATYALNFVQDFTASFIPNIVRQSVSYGGDQHEYILENVDGYPWNITSFKSFRDSRIGARVTDFRNEHKALLIDWLGRPIMRDSQRSPYSSFAYNMLIPFKLQEERDHENANRVFASWNYQNPDDTMYPSDPYPHQGEVSLDYVLPKTWETFKRYRGEYARQVVNGYLERYPNQIENPTKEFMELINNKILPNATVFAKKKMIAEGIIAEETKRIFTNKSKRIYVDVANN